MTAVPTEVSRPTPDLPRLEPMVTPRWLRERRRRAARAAQPASVAWEIAERLGGITLARRERSFHDLMRAQGVTPFDADDHSRRPSSLTSDDWAELRAALAEGRTR
jgi:hypothetical protein